MFKVWRHITVRSALSIGAISLLSISFCNDHNGENDGSKSQYLNRNFVADAVAVASPSVVNIRGNVTGFLAGETMGSGCIISKDGFIVTNAHVVAPIRNGEVLVTFWDGTKRSALVHSLDIHSDIALIKLKSSNEDLPIAKFGKSATLRAGEFVIALGSPLTLQNSVSLGIVSSPARLASELGMLAGKTEYIQTDAAINVGNSGGPLVNLDGEVIGINTLAVQNSSGISFAIPADIVTAVVNQLQNYKAVSRPYIGIKIVNAVTHAGRGWTRASSVIPIISDIEPNSPGWIAGLEKGDVILEIDGHKTKDVKDVMDIIIGVRGDNTFNFTVKKQNGSVVTVTVKSIVNKNNNPN